MRSALLQLLTQALRGLGALRGRAALQRARARFGAPLRAVLCAVAAAADEARRDAQPARAGPGASGARAEVLGLRLRLLSLGECSGAGGECSGLFGG